MDRSKSLSVKKETFLLWFSFELFPPLNMNLLQKRSFWEVKNILPFYSGLFRSFRTQIEYFCSSAHLDLRRRVQPGSVGHSQGHGRRRRQQLEGGGADVCRVLSPQRHTSGDTPLGYDEGSHTTKTGFLWQSIWQRMKLCYVFCWSPKLKKKDVQMSQMSTNTKQCM
jgi:hypothetical protein